MRLKQKTEISVSVHRWMMPFILQVIRQMQKRKSVLLRFVLRELSRSHMTWNLFPVTVNGGRTGMRMFVMQD